MNAVQMVYPYPSCLDFEQKLHNILGYGATSVS